MCPRDVPLRPEARPQSSLRDPRHLLASAEVAEGRRRKLTDVLRLDGRGLRATAVSAKSPWRPRAPPRTLLGGERASKHSLPRVNLLFQCVLLSRWQGISQTTSLSPFYWSLSSVRLSLPAFTTSRKGKQAAPWALCLEVSSANPPIRAFCSPPTAGHAPGTSGPPLASSRPPRRALHRLSCKRLQQSLCFCSRPLPAPGLPHAPPTPVQPPHCAPPNPPPDPVTAAPHYQAKVSCPPSSLRL